MKISIGINGYKPAAELLKREQLCIDALQKIKAKNTNVSLYNIVFANENIEYNEFTTLNSLKKKSNILIQERYKDRQEKKDPELPIVKEIFDVLANTDCDYFIFLNNDIILSNRLLNEIDEAHDCYAVSRVNIDEIVNLTDTPQILEYCVHGFDAFIIKKTTWLKIRNIFDDFILGRFYWDTYTATVLNLLCNCKNVNKLPPSCFHVFHDNVSALESIENTYCEEVFKQNGIIPYFWFNYVYTYLFKRQSKDTCKWYYPLQNETDIEQQHFGRFKIQEPCYDSNFKKIEVEAGDKPYDVFIPIAQKDENKLPFVVQSVVSNLSPKNIFVCSPHNLQNKVFEPNITYINDKDILDIDDRSFITFRPNWTYQQFLKLFFQSNSEYYFALDSDTFILKKISLFENGHPIWYYGDKQNHFPYFLFNAHFLKLYKTLDHTGIGDLGFFNKNITQTFLNYTGCTSPKELLFKMGNKINPFFHFSEYETYANFVNQYYPGLYQFKLLEKYSEGKSLDNNENWTEQELISKIKNAKQQDRSVLTLHSWKI